MNRVDADLRLGGGAAAPVVRPYGSGRNGAALRRERDCGYLEFQLRRCFASLFYWRIYRRLHPDSPFYTPRAVRMLDRIADPESIVFEWGSGASTLWLSRRVDRLWTVEHDPCWHARTASRLESDRRSNVTLLLSEPAVDGSLEEYSAAIGEFPDEHFDIIAIDGRKRVECLRQAVAKLKPGGHLLLDDSHRPRYAEVFGVMRDHPFRRYDFGILQTTLFRKVAGDPAGGRRC